MFLCKVIGNVVSQLKDGALVGKNLLLCEKKDVTPAEQLVAVDLVGAGIGSEVLVSRRYGGGDGCVDDLIVGIVDYISKE